MELTRWRDPAEQQDIFRLTISNSTYIRVELQPFDKMLIKECEKSEKVSDKLLVLETIARRIEEADEARLELQKKKKK